jgi:hypothetical protein
MAISFSCGQCGKRLKAPDSAAGKTSKCPGCGAPVTCPEPVYEAEPVEPQKPDVPEILDDVDPYRDLDDGTPYQVEEPPLPAQAPERRRPCPMCGEMILATAAKCRFCGEVFDETLKKATKKKRKKGRRSYDAEDENLSAWDWVLAILCLNIGCIVAIVYMVQGKPKGTKMLGVVLLAYVVFFVIGMVIGLLAPDQPPGQPGMP